MNRCIVYCALGRRNHLQDIGFYEFDRKGGRYSMAADRPWYEVRDGLGELANTGARFHGQAEGDVNVLFAANENVLHACKAVDLVDHLAPACWLDETNNAIEPAIVGLVEMTNYITARNKVREFLEGAAGE